MPNGTLHRPDLPALGASFNRRDDLQFQKMNQLSKKCGQMISRVASNNEFLAHSCRLHAEQAIKDADFARSIRAESGQTLRTLATAMGISAAHLSDLERGRRNWTNGMLAKWKAVLTK
jgi:DNA-binding transcriptional regulator YiaG